MTEPESYQEPHLDLRNDVYRRPLATALERLGIKEGWSCVDVGAGGGDVSIALAKLVGPLGRVYAVDHNPLARDAVAKAASSYSQVIAITQSGEDLALPQTVDLAFCRFLLMYVSDPLRVLKRMAQSVHPSKWVVAQEPITSAGRIGGKPFTMPNVPHPDVGAFLPELATKAGLELIDAWAEAQAGIGQGPVFDYLASLTDVDPGNDPIVLPPLVTIIARR
ncbi:MAG: methyltransferase domain-containing protein [Actinobacteria bacterium]|nr:methyltransferase domain-containing protein [Actinomycetota bacterium]